MSDLVNGLLARFKNARSQALMGITSCHSGLIVASACLGAVMIRKESLEIYWKHLRPDGILAIHVTNRWAGKGGRPAARSANSRRALLNS